MNKLTKILIILLTFQLACSKDDDGGGVKNEFTYDGKSYTLDRGFLSDCEDIENNSRDYDILLVSFGLSLDQDGEEIEGMGDYIYFDLNSSSTTLFSPGTFTWSDTRQPNTIVDAGIGINYNAETETGTQVEIKDGSVTVAISGNNYTITFTLTAENGKVITGFYQGTLASRLC